MPAAMNIQPAKRTDAKRLAAHAYRHGNVESHVDKTRSHLNQVLYGPGTFLGARAVINEIRQHQPNGRKVRTDANAVAQAIFTLPEELSYEQLSEWCMATLNWARNETPGRLMYATLHMDEKRPHIHAAFVAEEPDGKLTYKGTWGGPKKIAAERMRGLQASYAAAVADLELRPQVQGRQYHGGINGWRALKAQTAGKVMAVAEARAQTGLESHRLIEALPAGPNPPPVPTPPAPAPKPVITWPEPKLLESAHSYKERVETDVQDQVDAAWGKVVVQQDDWHRRIEAVWERIRERWATLATWRQKLTELAAERLRMQQKKPSAVGQEIKAPEVSVRTENEHEPRPAPN